jgi:hypothetical protein
MMGVCVALSAPVVPLGATFLPEPAFLEGLPALRGPVERFGPAWVSLGYPGLVLLFCSGIYGAEMGRLSRHHDGPTVPGLLFALPFPSGGFVRARLLMAALVQAALWGTALALVLAWAAVTGHITDMSDRLIQETGSPAAALVACAGGCLALGVIGWLALVSGMWMGLAGWQGRAGGPMLLEATFWIVLVFALLKGRAGGPFAVGLVGAALAAKAVVLAAVSRRVVDERLLRWQAVAAVLLLWAVVASAMAGAAGALFGSWLAAGVALLLLPVGRLLLAPLALHRARHA